MRKKLSLIVFVFAMMAIFTSSAFAQTTVVVNGNTFPDSQMQGWLFNRDASTSTPYQFNNTYSSIGAGSLYVLPIQAPAANKFVGEYFLSEPLVDVVSFSYDFKIGDTGNAAQAPQFYLNVYANFSESPDDKFYDCRYNVVPTTGSTSAFTTVTFATNQAYSVTRSSTSPRPTCPATPLDMGPGATIRAFAINLGDTTLGDVGLSGNFDNSVLVKTSGATVFDFEYNVPPPTDKKQCKNGGYLKFNNPAYENQGECVRNTVP